MVDLRHVRVDFMVGYILYFYCEILFRYHIKQEISMLSSLFWEVALNKTEESVNVCNPQNVSHLCKTGEGSNLNVV